MELRSSDASRESASLLALSQRDRDAFPAAYRAYSTKLLRYLARAVLEPEVAYDLHAELFAIAFERRHQFRGRTVAEDEGWLYAIARSLLQRYWRDGRVERQALQRLGLSPPALDDEAIERIEDLAELGSLKPRIEAALSALPASQREAVHLRIIDEWSYDQIAATQDVTQTVARARVSRGLRALGVRLGAVQRPRGRPR